VHNFGGVTEVRAAGFTLFFTYFTPNIALLSVFRCSDALAPGHWPPDKDFFISRNISPQEKARVHVYSNICMPSNIVYGRQDVSVLVGSLWPTLAAGTLAAGTKNTDLFISRTMKDRKIARVHLYSSICMPTNIGYGRQAVSVTVG